MKIKPNQIIRLQDTPAAQTLTEIENELTQNNIVLLIRYIQFMEKMGQPVETPIKRPRNTDVRESDLSVALYNTESRLSDRDMQRISKFMNLVSGRENAMQRPIRRAGPAPFPHVNGSRDQGSTPDFGYARPASPKTKGGRKRGK